MFSFSNILQSRSWNSKMSVSVGQISWSTNIENFCFSFVDWFQDSWVENWSLSSWVYSNKKNHISILNHLNLRIEQIVRSEIVRQIKGILSSKFIIEAVQRVEEIFETLNILDTFKLSNTSNNIFSVNFINSWSDYWENVLPLLLNKVSSFS